MWLIENNPLYADCKYSVENMEHYRKDGHETGVLPPEISECVIAEYVTYCSNEKLNNTGAKPHRPKDVVHIA